MVMQLPIWMTYLSAVLKQRINRWINIVAAVLTIAFVVGPYIGDSEPTELHYIFIASVEVVCMLAIIWMAWWWKKGNDESGTAA